MVIYGCAKAGRFRNLNVSGDRRFKDLIRIMLAKLLDHAYREQQTAVAHGDQNARDVQGRVVVRFDARNGVHQL